MAGRAASRYRAARVHRQAPAGQFTDHRYQRTGIVMIFLLPFVFTVVVCSIPVALGAVLVGWPASVVVHAVQRRRGDAEPPAPEWWPEFERDFRRYTSAAWVTAREQEGRD